MTARPVYDRKTCSVPGCTRWSRRFPFEWICGDHWRMIRASRRGVLRRLWRAMDSVPAGMARDAFFGECEARLFRAAVKEATRRAAGL